MHHTNNTEQGHSKKASEARTATRTKRAGNPKGLEDLAAALILERLEAIQHSLDTMHKDVRELQDDMVRRSTAKKLLLAIGSGVVAAAVWGIEKVISMKS